MSIIKITIDTENPLLDQVMKQLPKPIYFIKKEDVGKTYATSRIINGVVEYPFVPLGRILSVDVGKKCVKQIGGWFVENDEQFKKRLNK